MALILLVIEILHDLTYQNCKSYGSIPCTICHIPYTSYSISHTIYQLQWRWIIYIGWRSTCIINSSSYLYGGSVEVMARQNCHRPWVWSPSSGLGQSSRISILKAQNSQKALHNMAFGPNKLEIWDLRALDGSIRNRRVSQIFLMQMFVLDSRPLHLP